MAIIICNTNIIMIKDEINTQRDMLAEAAKVLGELRSVIVVAESFTGGDGEEDISRVIKIIINNKNE